MGPEVLLWHYPEDNIVSGSLLRVKSNHFCVLKLCGAILNVYETGQYTVHLPDSHLYNSTQLTFSGEPIPWQYEALYINRAKLLVKASGIALSREMAEVDYTVDYSIQVATRKDAIQLVQHMPYRGHTLDIREINVYTEPVIKQAVSQLVQITSLLQYPTTDRRNEENLMPPPTSPGTGHSNRTIPNRCSHRACPDGFALGQQVQELSQQVHQRLQQCLSIYGITVGMANVLIRPRDETMKALISLKAFGLSELDAAHYYTVMQKNLMEHRLKGLHQEQSQGMVWRNALERYADEIVALQAELESTCANIGLSMDAYSARLQKLSRAISNDLKASAPTLEIRGELSIGERKSRT
jgi:hypothetical protein